MASWGMARRVAELYVLGAAGQVAAVNRASMRLFSGRGFPYRPQKLTLSAESSFSSCISASSLSTASESSAGFPRPDEVMWQKGLVNRVNLIGRINQTVNIKYLDSGKIVADTSMRVNRPGIQRASDYTVFTLEFWGELAEIAAAHLKKEDHVYVAGSVWVESYMDQQSLSKSMCKVVARDLKFISPSYQTSNGESTEVGTEQKETTNTEDKINTEDLWRAYFQNPLDFWDNRVSKKNSKGPDFKHKATGAVLWLNNRNTPLWVHEKLSEEPPKLANAEKAKEMEKLWQVFFADPLEWWDNRKSKKTPSYPDFKNKSGGEALWIESLTTPSWVKSQLELLDSKMVSLKEGGTKSEWASASREITPRTTFEDEDLMFF
ncbi:hypothetical protein GOP47_0009218 [Adiantum capillus-veneris]|uniref:Uncharacterized protein n=1 Tax=Adiantum capillus-veneris TaxID=13818 RepID=A0A9D4ZIH1_ADICA|nr:hypothetical protein GOP47_0009218 [Adiantum capillus-veneris]